MTLAISPRRNNNNKAWDVSLPELPNWGYPMLAQGLVDRRQAR